MIMKNNKYGRKYTTQTIIDYDNCRLVTKTIVHNKYQQKREVDGKRHTKW